VNIVYQAFDCQQEYGGNISVLYILATKEWLMPPLAFLQMALLYYAFYQTLL